jgi:hypothetical protein
MQFVKRTLNGAANEPLKTAESAAVKYPTAAVIFGEKNSGKQLLVCELQGSELQKC